jgi:hypothetical protein
MGADLASVLCIFAILADGDIETESWYLGSNPNDHTGGLNRHSTVEADISPNREDFYMGCGDNHHLSSRMFTQNVKYAAADPSKQFTIDVMARQYGANARFSQQNNPYLYYFPFPSIVSIAAFNFYPAFFSNGTYGLGGVANYESISSIIGAKLDKKTGNFEYVAERWPENWYRRAYPYGAVQALTDGFTGIYPADPVSMPIGQVGTPNLNATNILCDVYLGLSSVTPISLAGDVTAVEQQITWALGKLVDAGLDGTALGCPASTVSPMNLFPNATLAGGALNEPAKEFKWTGNNQYNKTYFCSAPDTPKCSHTC